MEEISLMTSRILLVCALGIDCAEELVDFWEGGKLYKRSVAYSLRHTFANLINRMVSAHIQILPFLGKYHITSFERDQQRNALALRAFVEVIIDKRREDLKR